MYKVTLYDRGSYPNGGQVLLDTSSQNLGVRSATYEGKLNEAGSFTFNVAAGHPLYDTIESMKTYVSVEEEGDEIFWGRVIMVRKTPLTGMKQITCEGAYAFLLDAELPPDAEEVTMTPAQYLTYCVNKYNEQIGNDPARNLNIGAIDTTGYNVDTVYKNGSWTEVQSVIKSKIVDQHDGFITIVRQGTQHYINWVMQFGITNPQPIRLGNNVVNQSSSESGEDIFTYVRAVGKDKIEYGPVQLSAAMEAKYGKIIRTINFGDVESVEELQTKTTEYITKLQGRLSLSVDINFVDMHYVDDTQVKVHLGDVFTNLSGYEGVKYTAAAITRDLLNPANDKMTPKTDKDLMPSVSSSGANRGSSSGGSSGGRRSLSGSSSRWYKHIHETEEDLSLTARNIEISANEKIRLIAQDVSLNAENISSVSATANTLNDNWTAFTGTGFYQNRESINTVAGKFQVDNQGALVLQQGTNFKIDINGSSTNVGTLLDLHDNRIGEFGQILAAYQGSYAYQNNSELGAIIGRYLIDTNVDPNNPWVNVTPSGSTEGINPKELGWYEISEGRYVKTNDTTVIAGKSYYIPGTTTRVVYDAGSGYRIRENGVEYGVYTEGNLTGGIIIDRLNDGTVTNRIRGDRVIIGTDLTDDDLETWAQDAADGTGVFAKYLTVKRLTAQEITTMLANIGDAIIEDLATVGDVTVGGGLYIDVDGQPEQINVLDITKSLDGNTLTIYKIGGSFDFGIGSVSALVNRLNDNWTEFIGTGFYQNREHINAVAGRYQIDENGTLILQRGTNFQIDVNGVSTNVGTLLNLHDNRFGEFGQILATYQGSYAYQHDSEIGAIVGRYILDINVDPNNPWVNVTPTGDTEGINPKELGWYEISGGKYVKTNDTTVVPNKQYYVPGTSTRVVYDTGGGYRIRENGVEYGVYTEGNLTGGLIVDLVNDGSVTARIRGDRVILGEELTDEDLETWAQDAKNGRGVFAKYLTVKALTAQEITTMLANIGDATIEELATVGDVTVGGGLYIDVEGQPEKLNVLDIIKSADGKTLTVYKTDGSSFDFNKAVSLRGAWNGSTYSVSATSGVISGTVPSTTVYLGIEAAALNINNKAYAKVYADDPSVASNAILTYEVELEENVASKKVSLKYATLEKAKISTAATYNAGWDYGLTQIARTTRAATNQELTVKSLAFGERWTIVDTKTSSSGSTTVTKYTVEAPASTGAYADGWAAAVDDVSLPAAGTGESISVTVPSSTVDGTPRTLAYTMNNAAKNVANLTNPSGTVVAKLTHNRYNDGWAAAYAKVSLPTTGTGQSFSVGMPPSTVDGTANTTTYTLSSPTNDIVRVTSNSGTVVGEIQHGKYTQGQTDLINAGESTYTASANDVYVLNKYIGTLTVQVPTYGVVKGNWSAGGLTVSRSTSSPDSSTSISLEQGDERWSGNTVTVEVWDGDPSDSSSSYTGFYTSVDVSSKISVAYKDGWDDCFATGQFNAPTASKELSYGETVTVAASLINSNGTTVSLGSRTYVAPSTGPGWLGYDVSSGEKVAANQGSLSSHSWIRVYDSNGNTLRNGSALAVWPTPAPWLVATPTNSEPYTQGELDYDQFIKIVDQAKSNQTVVNNGLYAIWKTKPDRYDEGRAYERGLYTRVDMAISERQQLSSGRYVYRLTYGPVSQAYTVGNTLTFYDK